LLATLLKFNFKPHKETMSLLQHNYQQFSMMAQTSKEGQWTSHSQWVQAAVCGNYEWWMECFITAICLYT